MPEDRLPASPAFCRTAQSAIEGRQDNSPGPGSPRTGLRPWGGGQAKRSPGKAVKNLSRAPQWRCETRFVHQGRSAAQSKACSELVEENLRLLYLLGAPPWPQIQRYGERGDGMPSYFLAPKSKLGFADSFIFWSELSDTAAR